MLSVLFSLSCTIGYWRYDIRTDCDAAIQGIAASQMVYGWSFVLVAFCLGLAFLVVFHCFVWWFLSGGLLSGIRHR